MHLHSFQIKNFRRLQDVRIELAPDISIFVGANNSGKTSATQAIEMFLSGSKARFSLFDFSSHTWKEFDQLGNTPEGDDPVDAPVVSLDLWFEVTAADLYLVIPLLPSLTWHGKQVGIRIEFGAKNTSELLQNFRTALLEAQTSARELADGIGDYVPWPKSLSDFLQKQLQEEYEFQYSVLDRAQFDDHFVQEESYEPVRLGKDPSGASILNSLLKVEFLHAQRHLADPSANATSGGGRSEDLSKRLSRFYQRNLDQRPDDHATLKALSDSEIQLDNHLASVFEDTLKRLATLGYPGLSNPRLKIKAALNPASVMSQDARVHYVLGDGEDEVVLPDSYNGLGFKNLIYMVVEILDKQAKWVAEDESRAPLLLFFIEEPEAHLHAQLQQVFIRNVLDLMKVEGEDGSVFHTQSVVTTHSPHIFYERGFKPIRYFRRDSHENIAQTTQVLNLSAFYNDAVPKDRDFLERYLKLTHCDLFFADAAILVEGNVERLLLPVMIEKEVESLRSSCLCILEVGGAFAHRFRSLIDFLGLVVLIITDIDSVRLMVEAVEENEEDDSIEFEVADPDPSVEPKQRRGKACMVGVPDAVTSSQMLIQWLPRKETINDLLAATADDKTETMGGEFGAKARVAYQVPTEVEWAGSTVSLCGRTLEEAFGLENAEWCQTADCRHIGLKLRGSPTTPEELAEGLHKRVTGKGFGKSKFALGVLTEDAWFVPLYIKEGLVWLQEQIPVETGVVPSETAGVEVAE